MKALDIVMLILLIVGGLNWGLWGAFEFDLVATIFGGNTAVLAKVIYIVVGISALYTAARAFARPAGAMRPVTA